MDDQVTLLLTQAGDGDPDAKSRLFRMVEKELRMIADSQLRGERVDHSLQATVLVDDAFLRLINEVADIDWSDRKHFFRTVARAMRRMLIDHERKRRAGRRGGGEHQRVAAELDMVRQDLEADAIDLLSLDEALTKLREIDPRQSQIVELHHFGGFSLQDCRGENPQFHERSVFPQKREKADSQLRASRGKSPGLGCLLELELSSVPNHALVDECSVNVSAAEVIVSNRDSNVVAAVEVIVINRDRQWVFAAAEVVLVDRDCKVVARISKTYSSYVAPQIRGKKFTSLKFFDR